MDRLGLGLALGRKMIFMENLTPPVVDGNKQNSSLHEIIVFAAFRDLLSVVGSWISTEIGFRRCSHASCAKESGIRTIVPLEYPFGDVTSAGLGNPTLGDGLWNELEYGDCAMFTYGLGEPAANVFW